MYFEAYNMYLSLWMKINMHRWTVSLTYGVERFFFKSFQCLLIENLIPKIRSFLLGELLGSRLNICIYNTLCGIFNSFLVNLNLNLNALIGWIYSMVEILRRERERERSYTYVNLVRKGESWNDHKNETPATLNISTHAKKLRWNRMKLNFLDA